MLTGTTAYAGRSEASSLLRRQDETRHFSGAVSDQLRASGFPDAWRAVQYVESHDEVYRDRAPRIAALADATDARSWYARSWARVAAGLLLTAPGIPMIFTGMGLRPTSTCRTSTVT